MGWFVKLIQRNGTPIYVRPEMVKAVFAKNLGGWSGSNIVIDGHDYDVEGSPREVMTEVEFDLVGHAEPPTV